MNYIGQVWRPPSEASSLIIQATVGCSHNHCRFCSMYKQKAFFIRPVDDIVKDLKEMRILTSYVPKIFLADGDALVIKTDDLIIILDIIKQLYPECTSITCYASPRSIKNKSETDLKKLNHSNLKMVYMGLESGDDLVLSHINKGATAHEIITAGNKIRKSGIKLSVTAISGLGGTSQWKAHAIHTAYALSTMKPEYIGLLTLNLQPGSSLYKDVQSGIFNLMNPIQIASETRLLLSYIDSDGSIFRANHSSNYVNLAGTLNTDIPKMIRKLDAALTGQLPFRPEEMRDL
ncbi:MAG: radical SAM protein [Eubacteriaceae bacterium]|nr:radical SAM protein [Eubacteriaceae bacterium]MDD4507444.1 radical SAM protein [Eubacteriaceae bacterium]